MIEQDKVVNAVGPDPKRPSIADVCGMQENIHDRLMNAARVHQRLGDRNTQTYEDLVIFREMLPVNPTPRQQAAIGRLVLQNLS
jgi:hypothetical protein